MTDKALLKLGHGTGLWSQTQQQFKDSTEWLEKKKEKNQIVAVIQSESRPQPGLNTVVGFYSHKPQWPKQV